MKQIFHLESDENLINYFSKHLGKNYHSFSLEEYLSSDDEKKNNVLVVGDFDDNVKDIKEILGKVSKFSHVVFYSDNNKLEHEYKNNFPQTNRKYHFKNKNAFSEGEIYFYLKKLAN